VQQLLYIASGGSVSSRATPFPDELSLQGLANKMILGLMLFRGEATSLILSHPW
jgi:hypothetical protein